MHWQIIERQFNDKIFPQMLDQNKGKKWLANIKVHPDGLRLAACIAIDIINQAVDPITFAQVLDLINSGNPDCCRAFDDAAQSFSSISNIRCCSKLAVAPLNPGDFYVRVLEVSDFIKFYARPNGYIRSFDPNDTRSVIEDFFTDQEFRTWIDITKSVGWSGKLPLIFVLSFSELQQLLAGVVDRGNEINDALGFNKNGAGTDGRPEFVAVAYPTDFSAHCIQPTTFDASWEDDSWFYISYRQLDSWGRTQSCTGNGNIVKERVHYKLNALDPKFRGLYIGKSQQDLVPNRNELLQEAARRVVLARYPS